MGIPRSPVLKLDELVSAEPEVETEPPEVETDPPGDTAGDSDKTWSDKPTFTDQLWRFPETCKMGPVVMDMFVFKREEDRVRYNELMARTVPESAPDIVVVSPSPPQWSEVEGSFVELVKYKKVHYKRLIKKQP